MEKIIVSLLGFTSIFLLVISIVALWYITLEFINFYFKNGLILSLKKN